jgi:nickel/cobalt transporter (NicO) family protein
VAAASAHRRDEYLQAARIAIEPDRVELQLDLTPGIALADRVIGGIDRDGDGAISSTESAAYATRVEHDVRLELDGRALPTRLTGNQPAAVEAMRNGEGTLSLRWLAALPPVASGVHRLRLVNGHRPEMSVYLANVLVPSSDRVIVTAQDRDVDQRQLTVTFEVKGAPPRGPSRVRLAGLGGALAAVALLIGLRSVAR